MRSKLVASIVAAVCLQANCLAAQPGTPAGALTDDLKCYQSLFDISTGVITTLKNGTFLVPGVRHKGMGKFEKRGFYIFSDANAYFYPLESPQEENAQFRTYDYRIKVPGKADVFVTYRDNKNGTGPAINSSLFRYAAIKQPLTTLENGTALDEESKDVLIREIRTKLLTVVANYDTKVSYGREGLSNKEYALYKLQVAQRAEAALAACNKINDKTIHAAVLAQNQALVRALAKREIPAPAEAAAPAEARQQPAVSANTRAGEGVQSSVPTQTQPSAPAQLSLPPPKN